MIKRNSFTMLLNTVLQPFLTIASFLLPSMSPSACSCFFPSFNYFSSSFWVSEIDVINPSHFCLWNWTEKLLGLHQKNSFLKVRKELSGIQQFVANKRNQKVKKILGSFWKYQLFTPRSQHWKFLLKTLNYWAKSKLYSWDYK